MDNKKIKILVCTGIVLSMILYVLMYFINYIQIIDEPTDTFNYENSENVFKIISSLENEDLEKYLQEFSKNSDINLEVEYAGTLEIMEKINSGEQYDAVWFSNSIWTYMLNENIKISESASTSINPVIFAVKTSKAKE